MSASTSSSGQPKRRPRKKLTKAVLKKNLPILNLPRFLSQRKQWLGMGGEINKSHRILYDYADSAGAAKGHYYHQDLLVASLIAEKKPRRHIDIGSRIDGFVAHVAAFREIEIFDIRELEASRHTNIKFVQKDLMTYNEAQITDSISCLHAIEHFGLGRYGDSVDPQGHIKGVLNIVRMLEKQGTLYISFPIGYKDEVHFNAHRVFHPLSIFEWEGVKDVLELQRFDWVDSAGQINMHAKAEDAIDQVKYGCGIYTFRKLV